MGAVLVAGPVFLDIIPVGFKGFPVDGTESYVDSVSFSLGGAGITAGVLAMLGARSLLASSAGDDAPGAFLRSEFARLGIGLEYFAVSGGPTDVSLVFPSGGDRSFITAAFRDPGLPASVERAVLRGIGEGVSRMHLSFDLLGDDGVRAACSRARAEGISVSSGIGFDAARDWSAESWRLVESLDAFFLNRDELRMIAGADDVSRALDRLSGAVGLPVVTLGPEGCALPAEDGTLLSIPAAPARVVNPCGAGDSFAAAFLYAQERGLDRRRSAELAVRVGARTVESPGSIPEGITSAWIPEGEARR